MSRYNVEHKGKWACFSTISDSFITEFVDKEIYEAWRKEEYGRAGYSPLDERGVNIMSIEEAVHSISLNRTYTETVEVLIETGIDEKEASELAKNYGDNSFREAHS